MSNSLKIFHHSPAKRPPRNVFNLSHSHKLSCDMGQLIPIVCQEVIPGDKFSGSTNALIRMAPMLAPVMHNVNIYTHFFFVPNRLVWDEWQDFITGGPDGLSSPILPYVQLGSANAHLFSRPGTLADFMGIGSAGSGSGSGSTVRISLLPFRAYQLIYNEFYRDQNLQDEVEFSRGSGAFTLPSVESLSVIRTRAWEKDYFTSALPWAQRGAPVQIPFDTDLSHTPVTLNADSPTDRYGFWQDNIDGGFTRPVGDASFTGPTSGPKTLNGGTVYNPNGTLEVDLSSGGINVNDFRRAIRLQEWAENNARGGARYIEQIRSHFGVVSSDARLQRPEFLGGGKSPLVISEVLQTSSTDGTSPQANMAGHGISAHGSHTWSKFIEEHGYIIGIMSVIPRTAYQQGVPRHFTKFDRFDYYFPEFAHLGEQPIYNREIYLDTDDLSSQDGIFGYTPRFSEYKFEPDRVSGDFRTNLNYWHMGRIFDSAPALNGDFVSSDPTKRIFAVTDQDVSSLWCLIHNQIRAVRPMPKFGVPTI